MIFSLTSSLGEVYQVLMKGPLPPKKNSQEEKAFYLPQLDISVSFSEWSILAFIEHKKDNSSVFPILLRIRHLI